MDDQSRIDYLTQGFCDINRKFYKICLGFGIPDMADDVFQEYCINILEGKSSRQTLKQFFIDFCRKHRIANRRTKAPDSKDYVSLDSFESVDGLLLEPPYEKPTISFEDKDLINTLYSALWAEMDCRDRDMFKSYLQDEDLKDIALRENKTLPLISQRMTKLRRKMRAVANKLGVMP